MLWVLKLLTLLLVSRGWISELSPVKSDANCIIYNLVALIMLATFGKVMIKNQITLFDFVYLKLQMKSRS